MLDGGHLWASLSSTQLLFSSVTAQPCPVLLLEGAVGWVERKPNRVIKSSPGCCPHSFFKPQETGPKFWRI